MTRAPRRGGSIVIFVAAGAVLFLGLLALVVDVGGWYNERVRTQAVADLAAVSVLTRFPGAPTGPEARAFAADLLKRNGLPPGAATLRPDGPLGLEVRIGRPLPRRFGGRGRRWVDLLVASRARRGVRGDVTLRP